MRRGSTLVDFLRSEETTAQFARNIFFIASCLDESWLSAKAHCACVRRWFEKKRPKVFAVNGSLVGRPEACNASPLHTPLHLCVQSCFGAERYSSSMSRRSTVSPGYVALFCSFLPVWVLVVDIDASSEDDRILEVRNKESVLLRTSVIIPDSQSNCSIVSAHLYKGVDDVLRDSECSFNVTGTTMNECTILVSCHVGVALLQHGMKLHIWVLGFMKGRGMGTGNFTVSCDTLDGIY